MWTPVRRRSVSDEVFDQLKSRIVRGEMAPGAPLPSERKLAELLGVNRGALREALKRLEQARLVSIQHGGTTRVESFLDTAGMDLLTEMLFTSQGTLDTQVVRGVMEMRSALAPDIARLAALRATEDDKDALLDLVGQMERQARDRGKRQRLAMAFWGTMVAASQNIAYRLAYNTLNRSYQQFFEVMTDVLAAELDDLAAYRAIADAIDRGDTAAAEKRTTALISKGADQVFELMNALEAEATKGDVR
ncbi:MAG: FadR/GntR family transcriptional regulator [Deltaproteobacteria bacterium]